MPYELFKKLGLGESKSIMMGIQLVDRLVKYPRGIIEDVSVKVDKFIFPIDFVTLDMNKDTEVTLILSRPFLVIVRVIIDVSDDRLVFRVREKEVIFKISDAMRYY